MTTIGTSDSVPGGRTVAAPIIQWPRPHHPWRRTIRGVHYRRELRACWVPRILFLVIPGIVGALPLLWPFDTPESQLIHATGSLIERGTELLPDSLGPNRGELLFLAILVAMGISLYWFAARRTRSLRNGLDDAQLAGTRRAKRGTQRWRAAWKEFEAKSAEFVSYAQANKTSLLRSMTISDARALWQRIPPVPKVTWLLEGSQHSVVAKLDDSVQRLDPVELESLRAIVTAKIAVGLALLGGKTVVGYSIVEGNASILACSMVSPGTQAWITAQIQQVGQVTGVTATSGYQFWTDRGPLADGYYWGDFNEYRWGPALATARRIGGRAVFLVLIFFVAMALSTGNGAPLTRACLFLALAWLYFAAKAVYRGIHEMVTRARARGLLHHHAPSFGDSADVALLMKAREGHLNGYRAKVGLASGTVAAANLLQQRANDTIQAALRSQPTMHTRQAEATPVQHTWMSLGAEAKLGVLALNSDGSCLAGGLAIPWDADISAVKIDNATIQKPRGGVIRLSLDTGEVAHLKFDGGQWHLARG